MFKVSPVFCETPFEPYDMVRLEISDDILRAMEKKKVPRPDRARLWAMLYPDGPDADPERFTGRMLTSSGPGKELLFERKHVFEHVSHRQALVSWFLELHKVAFPTHSIHENNGRNRKIALTEDTFSMITWYRRHVDDNTIPEKQKKLVFASIAMALGPEEPVPTESSGATEKKDKSQQYI